MCRDWWTAYDQSGNVIADWALNKEEIAGMKINWKIQKNRRNNEPLSYKRDLQNKTFYVPRAIISMAERAERLGQAQDLPLAVYEKNGEMVYLTARKLTAYLRLLAREAHPTWTDQEIAKISAHSFRVWACMLLHEAEKMAIISNADYVGSVMHTEVTSEIKIIWRTSTTKHWQNMPSSSNPSNCNKRISLLQRMMMYPKILKWVNMMNQINYYCS